VVNYDIPYDTECLRAIVLCDRTGPVTRDVKGVEAILILYRHAETAC